MTTTTTTSDLLARYTKRAHAVVRGANLLDLIYGVDWPLRIDLDIFDMSESPVCLLGQLDPRGYSAAIDSMPDLHTSIEKALHGFLPAADEILEMGVQEAWDALTATWTAVIYARRAESRADFDFRGRHLREQEQHQS